VPTVGSYRVWVRILRGPDGASVPITINGAAAGSVVPALPAVAGFQWQPAHVVHLDRGTARIVLSGTSRSVNAEVAEIALAHAGSGESSSTRGIKRSWLSWDRDPLDAGLYRHPRVDWSHPIVTSRWRPVSGVRVTRDHSGMVSLHPTAAMRVRYAMAYASLPKRISAADPLALKFQGSGSGVTFYVNFYFRNGSKKSFSFQDSTNSARTLFFTPEQGKAAWRAASAKELANPYMASLPQLEVPDWNNVQYLTVSTNSRIWQGGTIRFDGPFPVRLTHSLPYFSGHFPAVSGSASDPRLGTQMISSPVSLHGLRSGILDFSQSYNPQWQLTGARAGTHTVALGFENSYLLEKGSLSARLSYRPALVGVWGTIVSMVAWCAGLIILIFWPLGRILLRRRGKERLADFPTYGETESGHIGDPARASMG